MCNRYLGWLLLSSILLLTSLGKDKQSPTVATSISLQFVGLRVENTHSKLADSVRNYPKKPHVRWQTRLPFPECINKTEPKRGSGGKGDSPREPPLKQNQTHTRHFAFQHGEALEVQIPTYFCTARQLKRGGRGLIHLPPVFARLKKPQWAKS